MGCCSVVSKGLKVRPSRYPFFLESKLRADRMISLVFPIAARRSLTILRMRPYRRLFLANYPNSEIVRRGDHVLSTTVCEERIWGLTGALQLLLDIVGYPRIIQIGDIDLGWRRTDVRVRRARSVSEIGM